LVVVAVFVGAGGGEVGECEHGQGDVGVPGSPGADLVMVQAGLVLRGLEALLDRPRAPATRINSRGGVVAGPAQR
jgi:hypothetical protein